MDDPRPRAQQRGEAAAQSGLDSPQRGYHGSVGSPRVMSRASFHEGAPLSSGPRSSHGEPPSNQQQHSGKGHHRSIPGGSSRTVLVAGVQDSPPAAAPGQTQPPQPVDVFVCDEQTARWFIAVLPFAAVLFLGVRSIILLTHPVYAEPHRGTQLWNNPYVWMVAAYIPFIAALLVYAFKSYHDTLKDEFCVGLWIQGLVTLLVGTYVDGGSAGHGHFHVLVCWPLLAPFLSIPTPLQIASVAVTLVFLFIVIADAQLHFGMLRFSPPVSFGWCIVSFLMGLSISLAVSLFTTLSLQRCRWRCEDDIRFVDEAVSALSELRTDAVFDSVEQRAAEHRRYDDLSIVVRQCASVLGSVVPYLPQAILNPDRNVDGGGGDSSDDDNGNAASSPTGDQATTNMETEGTGSSKFRRRRCTVMLVMLPRYPYHDVAQAAALSERLCNVLLNSASKHTGVVDILAADYALVTFNCHSPCYLRDARYACTVALEVSAALSDCELSIAIDHDYNLGGLCGAENRRAEIVTGDSVELVWKVAPLNNLLGTRILVTEAVVSQIGGLFESLPVDVIAPTPRLHDRRKVKPDVTLYELRPTKGGVHPDYTEAFALARRCLFQDALARLAAIPQAESDAQVMRLRKICEYFNVSPPYLRNNLARRELRWETFFADHEAAFESVAGAGEDNDAKEATEDAAMTMTIATLRQSYAVEAPKVEDEDALFTMFVSEPEPDAQDKDESAGLPTPLPVRFTDNNHEEWQRSENAIGNGAFAVVYLGLGQRGTLVAMKCFELASKLLNFDLLEAEVLTLKRLRHPNIVNYVTCATTGSHFIIVTEYVSGGSLHGMLSNFGALPESVVRAYTKDMLLGLAYLHDNEIVHCDIKPHNALLTHEGTCKLSDFGSALLTSKKRMESGNGEEVTLRGTSWYLAPEAARNQFSPAIDIWSLGCTVLELLTGDIPWNTRGGENQFLMKLVRDESMVPMIATSLSDAAKQFCEACCRRDALQRPTAHALLLHPFVTQA